MHKLDNMRLCRLSPRAHYWDLTTGKVVKFDRELLRFTLEQTCVKCEERVQRVQRQIDKMMSRQ